jgi:hypothetical protein
MLGSADLTGIFTISNDLSITNVELTVNDLEGDMGMHHKLPETNPSLVFWESAGKGAKRIGTTSGAKTNI